jgi:hypothetical protein
MKLSRLSVQNFRGLPDGDYGFAHPVTGAPLDVVIITGGQAAGKTSLLEAIGTIKESVGGYGPPPDGLALLRKGATGGRVQGTWLLSPDEQRRAGLSGESWPTSVSLGTRPVPPPPDGKLRRLLAEFFRESTHGKVEYFPAARRLLGAERGAPPPLSNKAEGRARLARDGDKYTALPTWLIEVAQRDALGLSHEVSERGVALKTTVRDALAPVKAGIAELAPHLRLLGVNAGRGDPRLAFKHASGAELGLDDLSDAERQAVLFAGAFVRLGLHHSVILLDTPELFLPPERHAAFLRGILSLGTDNQVFVATSSASIVSEALPHQLVRLPVREARP